MSGATVSAAAGEMVERYVELGARMAAEAATIDAARRVYDAWLTAAAPAPAGLERATFAYGGVRCLRLSMPAASPTAAVLYLHGGGYAIGSPEGYAGIGAALSAAGGAAVVSVDYRRAPEHPFPAALQDALAAYRALAAELDPSRIVLCGDSAGGGLVLALLLALRDAGDALPAGAAALSPWADLTLAGARGSGNGERDPVLSLDTLQGMALGYLQAQDARQPWASPAFGDFRGLPPLLLIAGGDELLRDDAVRCAERARAAGVEVELEIADGLFHAFPITPDAFPEARAACAAVGAFVRRRIAG